MVAVANGPRAAEKISDYAGLSQTHPLLAAAMTVSMLSLTGIPPLVGFVGKLYLFARLNPDLQVQLWLTKGTRGQMARFIIDNEYVPFFVFHY